MQQLEDLLFKKSRGLFSRFRIFLFRILGAKIGRNNRMEQGRMRRCSLVEIGNNNAFTAGWYVWPIDEVYNELRIVIGDSNYFNRNVMIDSCGYIEIGSHNMFGPDVYITDSNHSYGANISPAKEPMRRGKVKIGNYCWIGAKASILKDVTLGDYCVVAAGAVVTKSYPSGSVIAGIPARPLDNNK